MAACEEKKALQEDELQAIIAIYHNVVDLRANDVWKVSRPPEVLVECGPQSSDSTGAARENYVSLKLKINLTPLYPDECPSIEVLEPVGLSVKQIQELKRKLHGLCNNLLGQEMMFEMINCTQSYLYANNKPPPKSFYDQMISNNQKEVEERTRQAEEDLKLRQIEEDLEIEAELEKQQNEIKEENKRRRQARRLSGSEDRQSVTKDFTGSRYPSKSPRRHNDSSSSNESVAVRNSAAKIASPCPPDHSSTKDLSFVTAKASYQVIRGSCLCHDPAGNTLFSAMNMDTGNLLSLRQWALDFSKSRVDKADNLAKCRKMLSVAEQDLAKLIKLHDSSLVNYLSMQLITEGARILVTVLTEDRTGVSLSEFISLPYKIDLPCLTMISSQLVQSIVYLHAKQIVHKDIKPTVVYIHNNLVKLADFGVYRRLNEIHHAAVAGNLDSVASLVKRGQKEDVFRLGMTILFMISHKFDEDERLPTIPPDTNKELKNFLSQCFIADEKTRWSAAQLAEHNFLKAKDSVTGSDSKPSPDKEKAASDDETDQDSHLEAIIPRDPSGASRIAQEFQLLGIIGEGGFGQVLKVRNKLDRCLYAIKRITLNPKSKMLNKRITREVKLLSRLNHENVVRYYNSWLETGEELVETSETNTSGETATTRSAKAPTSVFFSDNIEVNAPDTVESSVAWSTASSEHSYESSDTASEDDSSELGSFFGHSFRFNSESEDVVFDYGVSYRTTGSHDSRGTDIQKVPSRSSSPLHRQFMYIQMEYCEKNTLRQAIDSGLHENSERVWRLFREIIEGLVHIHDQGMIHRDLKPVNIFLDVNDHVKIGDFGLATTAFIAKQIPEEELETIVDPPASATSVSQSVSIGDGRHTGRVGTLLYVSPEIKAGQGKTSYSQKVDIYSLGIIFFEMCYRPLLTMMERDRIIGCLRRPEILMPSDFTSENYPKQIAILRWVLNHDPSERPSSSELLQSDYLPRMEEEEVHELFRSMLSNPQTKGYKKIMSTIFSQPVSRKFDFTYDYDTHKGISMSHLVYRQRVRQRLESVFTRHGAVQLDLHLMLPKLSMYESTDQNVTFMDHAGNLVSLPYDLRVPFARFAARNNIVRLKRYAIGRVFRERKPHGIQPHEHLQCAFDIISPSQESLVPDAEVLSVIQEVLNEFPYLQSRKYAIQMNHTLLMTAILLYCGIGDEQHNDVLTALADPKLGDRGKSSAYSRLQSLSINDQAASQICAFIDMSGSFSAVSSYLRRITKSGQKAGSLAKKALHEMESLITYVTALGVTMPVLVNLGFIYSIQNSSGVVYQIAAETSSTKSKAALEVIAGGYRYDKLVSTFKRSASVRTEDEPAAVGMSLLFEKLVSAVRQEADETSIVSVVLFCVGKSSVQKEWLKLAQEFWNHGINTSILSDSSMDAEKVEAYCRESSIKYIVTLSDYDPGQAKLKCTGSAIEKRFNVAEILEEVIRRVNPPAEKFSTRYQQGDYINTASADKPDKGSELHTHQMGLPISVVLQQETKPSLKARNKTETLIHNHLNNSVLALLKKASEAEVVAFELGLPEVKALAAAFSDSDNEDQFDMNCSRAMQSQESAKNRKYMSKIVDRLRQIKFQINKPPVVIIYGLKDNSYRVIMG